MQLLPSLIISGFACISVTMAADDVIVLDPLTPREMAFEVPLFGYRQFPEEIFARQKGEKFGLPIEWIYASAAKVPAIEAAAAASGKAVFDLEASEVIALARSKRDEIGSSQRPSRETMAIMPWARSEVDATFITALLSSELMGHDYDVFDSEILGGDAEMISIDKSVGIDFWSVYSNLSEIKRFDPSEKVNQFDRTQTTLSKYPALLQAARLRYRRSHLARYLPFLPWTGT
jgi:hypothetical protein